MKLPLCLAALIVCLLGAPVFADASATPAAFYALAPESPLKRNVDFWVKIYSHYDTDQLLIHDAKYVDHVYEVLDLSSRPVSQLSAKRKWREILLSVHRKQEHPEKMSSEELRVFQMFSDVSEPNKFLAAAHRRRLRIQRGQKEHFLEGLRISGRYLPHMEEIFRKEGLPVELTRLPFVESSFNTKARSKVGASGIWQFMRSTGSLYLTVNDVVDERNDPIRATEAAAKLLKQNYESLPSWPLAVTSYNHGRIGVMRAVRRVGSDRLEDVISDYRIRSFGFASSNFFTCLLAAIEIEKQADRYFGDVKRDKLLNFFEIELPDSILMKDLVRFMKLNRNHLKELNPALSEAVFRGRVRIPAGYRLRLPKRSNQKDELEAKVFMAGYTQIPKIYRKYDRGGLQE